MGSYSLIASKYILEVVFPFHFLFGDSVSLCNLTLALNLRLPAFTSILRCPGILEVFKKVSITRKVKQVDNF